MKYFYAYDKDPCILIFKDFSNLILAPTFGDSLKLASMSSAKETVKILVTLNED